ncbi:MAG: glycosyltransferase family 2 protein [Chloroherpetonaceae bacterium]|nr:glycosyltransferase family 2 protein [Chthonomonadaceae bacterium]MDW8207547.1 glycosyltransferase family 2 protein [Chloroherpetonaceae bacterium]
MISALIPAHNEAERIGLTIAALRQIPQVTEILVVDDGSTDSTSRQAENAGADIVFRQQWQGKGDALNTALALAQGHILLLLDADLGATATEARLLLEPVLQDTADMTIATFPTLPGRGGGMGLVVRLARWGIRALTGHCMQAPLSGQRAVRREVVEACGGFATGWGVEVALTVRALRLGYRVQEVPTRMSHRVTGRDLAAVCHRGKQFISVARTLYHLAIEREHKHE